MIALLPRLAEQFHLTPSDVWALTLDELNVFIEAAQATDRQIAEAERRYG